MESLLSRALKACEAQDINSLEELNELIDEVKEKVIIGCDDIEIYDDYRE